MSKKNTNEGLFGAAKKFSDAFFDGLQKNTADKVIKKAHSAKMDKKVVDTMKRIEKEKKQLDRLLGL